MDRKEILHEASKEFQEFVWRLQGELTSISPDEEKIASWDTRIEGNELVLVAKIPLN